MVKQRTAGGREGRRGCDQALHPQEEADRGGHAA